MPAPMQPKRYLAWMTQQLETLKRWGDNLKRDAKLLGELADKVQLDIEHHTEEQLAERILNEDGDGPRKPEYDEAVEILENLGYPTSDDLRGVLEAIDDDFEVGIRKLKTAIDELGKIPPYNDA